MMWRHYSKECDAMSDDSNTARWREDFPVRWDADHYLTRRELAKFLTLGSGILAAATGALAIAGREAPQALYPAVRIPSATQLLPGTSLLFRYPTEQDPCILIKTGSGELRAYSQVCTHLSCAVRYETEDNRIACPCHRGFFDVEDGRPTGGPPTRRLPRVVLRTQADGVYAVGMEA
jgi:nitrite reductase/ring-hydroxylating ferredoxin subunit